jgi:hypothetical protein
VGKCSVAAWNILFIKKKKVFGQRKHVLRKILKKYGSEHMSHDQEKNKGFEKY